MITGEYPLKREENSSIMSTVGEETPSTKGSDLLEKRFNTIRQRSNSFWKTFSIRYARFLLNYPRLILALSLLFTIGLSGYFLAFMRMQPFDQSDFLMKNGESMQNARRLRELFGDDTSLRVYQHLDLYPALDVIIKRKVQDNVINHNQTNMLDERIIDEVLALNELIQTIVIGEKEHFPGYNYSSLCVKFHHACMIDGNYLLSKTFRQDFSNLSPPKNGYFLDGDGANGIPDFIFGKHYRVINVTVAESDYDEEIENQVLNEVGITTPSSIDVEPSMLQIISYVPLFRLRYALKSSTPEWHRLAVEWERAALKFLNENYQSKLLDLSVSTSTAIPDAIAKKSHEEGLYLAIVLLTFFALVFILSSLQGNRLTSLGLFPICVLLSIALATGATFGLLTVLQVQIIEPMALIVLVVSLMECMRSSIIFGEYHRIIDDYLKNLPNVAAPIHVEQILASIIECTHPYFLLSTFILSIVYFLLASFTPMASTAQICLTLVLYIIINYAVHATFFSSCLVITLRRLASHRHCLTCHRLPVDFSPISNTSSTCFRKFSKKFRSLFQIDSIYKKFIIALIDLLAIVGVFFSVWFALSIDTRLFDDAFIPPDAQSLRSYMKSQVEDFNIGPMVIFTIPQPVDYRHPTIRSAMSSLLDQCQSQPRINRFQLFWLEKENIDTITQETIPLEFRITPFSHNDLVIQQEKNHSTIVASRFYCQYRSLSGDREDIRTMNNLYAYAKQSSLPSVFPYSLVFPSYEALTQIRFDISLLVTFLLVIAFILTFIPFIWLKISISISFHLLFLIASTLACLYQFHHLTFNFANAIWLLILPALFTETIVHTAYFSRRSQWKYNRVLLSLMLSLLILYIYPIQSYVFIIIRNSLMYQSVICLILINLILPSSYHLLFTLRETEASPPTVPIQVTTASTEGTQSLTNGIEVHNVIYRSDANVKSSI